MHPSRSGWGAPMPWEGCPAGAAWMHPSSGWGHPCRGRDARRSGVDASLQWMGAPTSWEGWSQERRGCIPQWMGAPTSWEGWSQERRGCIPPVDGGTHVLAGMPPRAALMRPSSGWAHPCDGRDARTSGFAQRKPAACRFAASRDRPDGVCRVMGPPLLQAEGLPAGRGEEFFAASWDRPICRGKGPAVPTPVAECRSSDREVSQGSFRRRRGSPSEDPCLPRANLVDIKEVLRRWSARQSLHHIARDTGVDRRRCAATSAPLRVARCPGTAS